MNLLLVNPHLDIRGTTDQLWKYSFYNQTILGNKSFIAAPSYTDLTSWPRFREAFGERVFIYDTWDDLQTFVDQNNIDVVYFLKYGTDDGKRLLNAKNVMHVVFDGSKPHGDKYAAVSKWLGERYNIPHVPHIVTLPKVTENYREVLGIPDDAIIVGRHGGADSFDIPFVHETVYEVASMRPDMYFLMLNTNPFCPALPNIIHLEPTINQDMKTAFINTCDVMIHGRKRGETFGLAVAEFLHQNKPVITYIDSPERNHIEILGDKGLYYENNLELRSILLNFVKQDKNYNHLVEEFSPEKVMKQFQEVFLK